MKAYLEPSLKTDFAHYVIRLSILKAVRNLAKDLSGVVVDLGSGNMPYKEIIKSQKSVTKYISVDWNQTHYYKTEPDVLWDGISIPLENDSVDCVFMTEVLEHLDEPLAVLIEARRILKPGGILVGTTPFVWPLHEVPNDMQRFTPYGLARVFNKAGFSSQEIIGAGGWKTSLGQFLSAFIGFGIRNKYLVRISKIVFHFPILWLVKTDNQVKNFDHTGMMNLLIFKAFK